MRPPPGRRVYTVSEVTGMVVELLEKSLPQVWVQGEVSGFKPHSSGHWYFGLKDKDAYIRAVMFKSQNMYLGFTPGEGDSVLCRGRVTAYPPRSTYQVVVEWMEPSGIGALYLEFERLKTKLSSEGLFDPENKRPLPSPVRSIAIITSLAGAALHDMLAVLQEQDPAIQVLIIPASVQGEGAEKELAAALALANRPGVKNAPGRRPLQAIIIGRGGGSIEDLWAFNREELARAVHSSKIAVISAVGHEVDYTICDFAADLRAPTPTAAAEMVASGRAERMQGLAGAAWRLENAMKQRIESGRMNLMHAIKGLRDPGRLIMERSIRLDELTERVVRAMHGLLLASGRRVDYLERTMRARDPRAVLLHESSALDGLKKRLSAAGRTRLAGSSQRVEALGAHLFALSPRATLARGYSIARHKEAGILREAGSVKRGDEVEVILYKGRLGCEVKETNPEEEL